MTEGSTIVSREGLIRYETNRYSVPADHIGKTAILKIDTLGRTADIFIDGELVRTFDLLAKGAKSESIRKADRDSLINRWKKENRRTTRNIVARVPKTKGIPHSALRDTEVDTRNPENYDWLFGVAI